MLESSCIFSSLRSISDSSSCKLELLPKSFVNLIEENNEPLFSPSSSFDFNIDLNLSVIFLEILSEGLESSISSSKLISSNCASSSELESSTSDSSLETSSN